MFLSRSECHSDHTIGRFCYCWFLCSYPRSTADIKLKGSCVIGYLVLTSQYEMLASTSVRLPTEGI
ncbi:hypothetical protein EG68_09429 [Paragonimus skrjabini miyazakii]|uniref:Uncharacterized protein n=1 Tax=Paragonimus skrjabini miyazakii TaxID=59628 RepID=A0A8S9YR74_9TREM|nr:hypothetical protein EG68_09429 [Paragonimus skrjabini miyazakii]